MRKRLDSPEALLIMKLFDLFAYIDLHQVTAHLGIAGANARRHLKELHKAKKIYITDYIYGRPGPALPLFSKGNREDARRKRRTPYQKKLQNIERKEKKCLSTLWLISKPQELKQVVVS
jgi:predicted ArsR family transcriptional regulator